MKYQPRLTVSEIFSLSMILCLRGAKGLSASLNSVTFRYLLLENEQRRTEMSPACLLRAKGLNYTLMRKRVE